MNKINLFVSDQSFAPLKKLEKYKLINIFPNFKNDDAYRSNLDELNKRSIIFSNFYKIVGPKLDEYYCKNILDIPSQVKYLTKPILINITTIFFDRYVRIINRIGKYDLQNSYVLGVKHFRNIQTLDHFNCLNSSWHANQDIIQRIMEAIGYNIINLNIDENDFEYPNSHNVPNMAMKSYDNLLTKFIIKINYKVNNFFSILFRQKILNIGLSIDDFYLKKAGLYNFGAIFSSKKKINNTKIICSAPNYFIRNQFKNDIYFLLKDDLFKLFNDIIPSPHNSNKNLIKVWVDLYIDWFPTSFIENINTNVYNFDKLFKNIYSKTLIGDTLTSEIGILLSVAAKKRNITIIGCQHNAGHYGYIEDLSLMYQFELNHYDYMITFGWENVENYFPICKFIKLPSPKLSESPLKKELQNLNTLNLVKNCQILFLSNLFHRFPHASTCGQSRVDFIDQIFESQQHLVEILTKNKITVYHKPYNMRYVDLYKEHFNLLAIKGGNNYKLLPPLSKGLTIDLIKGTNIILWDQLGSGAVECFISEIPTMILWERIYSRENSISKFLISNLEKNGIIHKTPESLALEVKRFLEDPFKWVNSFKRKEAISTFCRHFAWSTNSWEIIWKNELKSFI